MAPKEPEQWILFLLALTEGTPDFQPDWAKLAQDTGLYKSGHAMRNAYKGLVRKYDGQIPGTNTSTKAGGSEDSSAKSTPAAAIIAPTTPKTPRYGRKRVVMDAIADTPADEGPITRKRQHQIDIASSSTQTEAGVTEETGFPVPLRERLQPRKANTIVVIDEDDNEDEEGRFVRAMRRAQAQAAASLELLAADEIDRATDG